MLNIVCGSAKIGSFAFAKGWFVCWAKANVPIVGWQLIVFKMCGGKKLKHEALVCRVGKKVCPLVGI